MSLSAAANDLKAFVTICANEADFRAVVKSAGLGEFAALKPPEPGRMRILLLVDLGMWCPNDPDILPASTVECFIDLLAVEFDADFVVGASTDQSATWSANRDVHALAELAGYRYETDSGHPYDIVDLGEDVTQGCFSQGSVLFGTPASREWMEADLRIVLTRPRPQPEDGFAGSLETLFNALPLKDKRHAYRLARSAGDAVSALLYVKPPDFVILDGRGSIGSGGKDNAGLVIASPSPLLADFIAGLKFGLDPFVSPLLETVARDHPLPAHHVISGDTSPLPAMHAPSPILQRARRQRAANPLISELSEPWLQALSTDLFPLNRPVDARLNAILSDGEGASRKLIEMLLGASGAAVSSYQCLFDKDSLLRRVVPLDVDPESIEPEAYVRLRHALESVDQLARSAPQRSSRLRWRRIDGAVVFAYHDELAIPFDAFVQAVEVAHAIQYMNDYLGGIIVPVELDSQGRPVRQVERNLYLPQPNYLVLYGGQPIDVTKIEVALREPDRHRLYWQTIHSANHSATADDGIVTFERSDRGTRITISGKQAFTLPVFWQLFDVRLFPALDEALTTDAYRTFFSHTIANFEALVEGRDIAIGRNPDEPSRPAALALEAMFGRLGEAASHWLEGLHTPSGARIDDDGFVHGAPARASTLQ